jgi:biofilm PGA synthesis N-glycosyltransferase PgaC
MTWSVLYVRPIKKEAHKEQYEGVSIVIAAKNEEENITRLLKALHEQDYPTFEIIVVDDYSSDQTKAAILALSETGKIRYRKASKDVPGKKWALTEGIAVARYPILLMTDADCWPNSRMWIQSMFDHLGTKEICIGYGPLLASTSSSWFAKLEGIWIALQYFTFANIGRPYMAVGRNLMFRKALFDKYGGYQNHLDKASGDDDLLIQEMANSNNVAINLDTNSWVFSKAPSSWRELIQQKIRHLSTATSYKIETQLLLVFFSFIHLGIYILAIILLIRGMLLWTLLALVLKYLLQSILHGRIALRLGGLLYLILFPLIEIFLSIYYLLLSPFLWWRKRNSW